ncbi:MAG: hypothetical protein H5T45_00790 [Thermoplasmatales archaeon]|nr:hypothetical protein [Thermoplasmatales archaeon]
MNKDRPKEPLIIRVRATDLDDFNTLLNEKESPFINSTRKAVFLMAMAIGYRERKKISLEREKTKDYDRVAYLNPAEKALIKAVAIADKRGDLQVLLNPKEVYSIAESYAAGGIKILKNKVFSGEFGSYIKKLEIELLKIFEKLSHEKTVE